MEALVAAQRCIRYVSSQYERLFDLLSSHTYELGGISSVTIMGQTLVIVHDVRLAFELLEKRSVKHSSRPKQVFAGEM